MYKPERTSIGIPLQPEQLYVKLYQFIDSVIDGFEPPIQDNDKSVEAEDKITVGMSRYLDSKSEQSDDVFKFVNLIGFPRKIFNILVTVEPRFNHFFPYSKH